MKKFFLTCCAAVLLGTTAAFAGAPSASDFIAPVDGGTTTVEQPNAVKVDEDAKTITANSYQDAANKVANDDDELSEGAWVIKVGSGSGFCAKGVASYEVFPNPNATIQSKRVAYVYAYTKAKSELAKFLNAYSTSGRDIIQNVWEHADNEETSSNKRDLSIEENLNEAVDGIIRGFVTYEVHEIPDANANDGSGSVAVTIIATPKTIGKTTFVKPDAVSADTIAEGLEQVLRDIKSGLVTPVGGRVIFCKATGELAYVGFGSEINRKTSDPTFNRELKIEALHTARMRAASSLSGIISEGGDNIKTSSQLAGKTLSQKFIQDTYKATEGDPLAKPDVNGIARTIDQKTSSFSNTSTKTTVLESLRNGTIPPGVQQKSWTDESGDWSVAVAVYIPSLTKQAADFNRDMQNSQIVKPYGPSSDSPTTIIPKKEGAGKFGSGKVHNDDDL